MRARVGGDTECSEKTSGLVSAMTEKTLLRYMHISSKEMKPSPFSSY